MRLGGPSRPPVEQRSIAPVWLLISLITLLTTLAVIAVFWHRTSSRSRVTNVSKHLGEESLYPKPTLTPGALDPTVTQNNIQETICVPGYTTHVRPRSSVMRRIRVQVLANYQFYGRAEELDHLIPLELGGCPDCVSNLWPEPYEPRPGAREKDLVENFLHRQVCIRSMTLAEAQKAITSDWYSIYVQIRQSATATCVNTNCDPTRIPSSKHSESDYGH